MLILTWAAAGSGCEDAATGAPARNLAKKIYDCQRMGDYFKASICQNITLIRGTWGFTVARLRTATDTLIMGCDSTAQFWVKKPTEGNQHWVTNQSHKATKVALERVHATCSAATWVAAAAATGAAPTADFKAAQAMLIDIWWWITLKIWHFFPTSAVLQFQVICCISFLCQINLSNPCTIKNVCTIWNEGFLWSITKASDYISRHWFRTERHYNSRYHTEFLSSVSLATEQVSKTKSIINDLIYFFADSSVFFGGHYSNFWEPAIYFAFLPNHPPPLLPLLPPEKSIVSMIHTMIKYQWFGIYQPEALRARPRSPLVPWVPPQAYRLLTQQGFCQLRPEVKIIEWRKYWTLHNLFDQQL